IYEATWAEKLWPLAATVAAVAANALIFACAGIVAVRPFTGPRTCPKDRPADPGWGLALGPVVLAALGLVAGLWPGGIERALVGPMVAAVTGAPMEGHLTLWHGVGTAFLLSLLTFAVGAALYLLVGPIRDGLAAAEPRLPRTEAWYDWGMAGLGAAARRVTAAVQNGAMTSYLRYTFLTLALLTLGALLLGQASWPGLAFDARLIDWAIVLLVAASIVVVVRTHSRLTAITALGGVGAGIAIVYVVYGAIDVAMTQIFVEILVVVFLAIAMVRLPPSGAVPFHLGNAVVAALLGVVVTLAVLAVLGTPLDPFLTRFFEENSYPAAHGRNVVNVILVDFRGFDTMGEISVIVIAGIAAIAVLTAGRRRGR
ncbi:MAG TPA: hydrogen gas-evolving membrane-bound hydrogenase subunit E, partial [Amaricoccus sp.]|nr:hydrogen gas-evolving membrane-bound hydrogenase subunit E [Amaricoccus sp.]